MVSNLDVEWSEVVCRSSDTSGDCRLTLLTPKSLKRSEMLLKRDSEASTCHSDSSYIGAY
jgi:hypothetical protein